MPNLDKIRSIQKMAAAEKWPYPQLFDALAGTGLDRYEVNVLTHETTFVGDGAAVTQAPPEGWATLTAGPWNEAGVRAALKRTQAGETDYKTFLSEMAAAGISFYRVDFRPRTVTYHGPKPRKIVEAVPA